MQAFNSQKYGSTRSHHDHEVVVQKVEHQYMLKISKFICSLEVEDSGNTRESEANRNKDEKEEKGEDEEDSNARKWNMAVVNGLPSQTNHLDCGVFATFYADCMRNQVTIKSDLTKDEIASYRCKMHKYILKGRC